MCIDSTVADQINPTNFRGTHDDVIKWKYFSRYQPFVWGVHRCAVDSPQRTVTRNFDVFLHLRLSKRLRKYTRRYLTKTLKMSWNRAMKFTIILQEILCCSEGTNECLEIHRHNICVLVFSSTPNVKSIKPHIYWTLALKSCKTAATGDTYTVDKIILLNLLANTIPMPS